jgi:hypothetical protein
LNNQDGDAGEQKHVDEAALVKHKLQDEPNNQQARPDDPHFRFYLVCPRKLLVPAA